jgi:subtilisin family serine protease
MLRFLPLCLILCVPYMLAPAASAQQLIVSEQSAASLADDIAASGAGEPTTVIDELNAAVIDVPASQAAAVTSRLRNAGASVEADVRVHAAAVSTSATDPNDEFYGLQWALAAMHSVPSWAISRGAGVTVAVVDTGVDASHPDLIGQVLTGYDFVDGDTTTQDGYGHGTHVAGIIAARANNQIGVAGVAPDSRILPVRVLDDSGSGYLSDVAAGIVYAADHNARVINLSLGAPSGATTLADAVTYARGKGALVVCAAGNDAASQLLYPAAYDGCESVAATDQSDQLASFSNGGPGLDVSAPGVDIASTYPGDNYVYESGTSMAAPMVSAVLAQLIAMGTSPAVALADLHASALDLGAPGYDLRFGAGRIDALAAVTLAKQQLAGHLTVTDVATPQVGQIVISGQALSSWKSIGLRTSAGTVRIYSTRANVAGVTFSSSSSQITIMGLTQLAGRTILAVTVDGATSSTLTRSVLMPLAPVQLTASAGSAIDVTGRNLDGSAWLLVQDETGTWHFYANPRSAQSGDTKPSLWTSDHITVRDARLSGHRIVAVSMSIDRSPLSGPLTSQTVSVAVPA